MPRLTIGLGANLGDRWGALRNATDALRAWSVDGELRASHIWETEPQGPVLFQPWFWNACAELDVADIEPADAMALLLQIERRLGRTRDLVQGPRTIDLDLLLWGERIICEPDLVVPHPRLCERAFVLAPLAELVGEVRRIPGDGRTVGECLRALSGQTVRRLGPLTP